MRKSVGGDLFNVFWRSASDKTSQTSVARVTDVGTGEYMAMFNETSHGAYAVSIVYEDRCALHPLFVLRYTNLGGKMHWTLQCAAHFHNWLHSCRLFCGTVVKSPALSTRNVTCNSASTHSCVGSLLLIASLPVGRMLSV